MTENYVKQQVKIHLHRIITTTQQCPQNVANKKPTFSFTVSFHTNPSKYSKNHTKLLKIKEKKAKALTVRIHKLNSPTWKTQIFKLSKVGHGSTSRGIRLTVKFQ